MYYYYYNYSSSLREFVLATSSRLPVTRACGGVVGSTPHGSDMSAMVAGGSKSMDLDVSLGRKSAPSSSLI